MTEATSGGISNEPVIASTPTPISVEPRVAPAGEVAEVARQAEEARIPKEAAKPVAEKTEPSEKAKPLSIKESLAKAREKIEADPAKPLSVAAKAAEATATKETKESPAPKNDTKAISEPATTAPARAEDGKFVSTKPAVEVGVKTDTTAPDVAKPTAPALPSHTASAPPARFSAAAKEEWASLPEASRSETERAIKELQAGHEKYRAAAERDSSIAEFHELAAKGGTDVKTALGKYVGMENLLRQDPIKGLEEIAKNTGLNLRDVAAKILNQTPDQARSESDATIHALTARLEKAEAAVGSIHAEKAQAQIDTTKQSVDQFAADPANPRFEELSEDIAFFLKSGRTKDLAEAYKLAERLNPAPAVQAQLTTAAVASSAPVAALKLVPPAAAPSSSDAGTRSITGTPTAGSDPVRKQPSNSIKEALRRAQAAVG